MFIFNFDGEKLVKKWTGSQIAGMWDNFYVGELLPIPGEELIFIEKLYDQGVRLHVYYWFNFGFMLLASSDIYEEIIDVTLIDENRIQITNNNEQGEQTLTLLVKDGEISSVFR